MGFKRAILNRLGITDKKVLLSAMDDNNDNGHDDGSRKHTDFSIAKILSEDTPRILHHDRLYQLNDLVWNNRLLTTTSTSSSSSSGYSNLSGFVPTTINTKYEIMNFSFCMYDPRSHLNTLNTQINPNNWLNQKRCYTDTDNIGKNLNSIYQSVNSYGRIPNLIDKTALHKTYALDCSIKEEPIVGGSAASSTAPTTIVNNNNSTCSVCQKVFENALALEAHEKSHKSPRYKCDECGKGFSQLRNYKYHVSVHKGTKEFAAKCPECDKLFNDKGYLSSHLKIHRNKKEYSCPHCPKSFNQRVAFNMHVRIHSGIKPHKCFECGKCFSRKMLLKQHLRTHSGEKPYQCSICLKTFADRSNMTLHQRLHSGIKPFACNICPKAFTKKHHLKTHLNYHIGCKPYICPHTNCGKSFTQSSNMRTHSRKCEFKPPEGNA